MQVTHAGYQDPNNLKFDNIVILGEPHRPTSVSVTHVQSSGDTTTNVPDANIQHEGGKQVKKCMFMHGCKIKHIIFHDGENNRKHLQNGTCKISSFRDVWRQMTAVIVIVLLTMVLMTIFRCEGFRLA